MILISVRQEAYRIGPFPEYSSAAIQKLEDDVIKEIIAKRKSKANRNSTAKALDYITRYISRYFSI
jgi:hypothetical protein